MPKDRFSQPTQRNRVDGHTLIAQTLKHLGVTHVYSVSGTPIHETLPACSRVGIRPIGVHHQQSAALMAAAQNYMTGGLTAIVILSAGPAITNAATGILVAHDNCWPILVLGGRRPIRMMGKGSFQDLDAVPVFHSITKWSALVKSASQIPEFLNRAHSIATNGRPGPVYLDLPEEALMGTGPAPDSLAPMVEEVPIPDSQTITRAAEILLAAKRPAVIIGKGLRWAEPYEELLKLVNGLGIPFITSPMGKGYLPDDHPLCYTAVGNFLQANADAVLLLGARLNWTFRYGSQFPCDTKLIHVDIHPQEIGNNIPATVGLAGDVKMVLQKLLVQFDEMGWENLEQDRLKDWYNFLNKKWEDHNSNLDSLMNSDSIPMSHYRMMKEIRDVVPPNSICVIDGNVSMEAGQEILPSRGPASWLTAGTNGCMGVGIPFGIGAKLSNPDRPVVVVSGDMAFGLNAMELETAVRHRIPLIVIVANNEGLSGGLVHKRFYPPDHERVTLYQPGIRYEQIMETFGGHAEYVERPEQFNEAFERAMTSGLPACINVKVAN